MMLNELATQIWGREQFHDDYLRLVRRSLQASLGIEGEGKDADDPDAMRRLVQSAAHFAASDNIDMRNAAYTIGVAFWKLSGSEYPSLAPVMDLILSRLGNFPTRAYFHRQIHSDDLPLPLPLWIEREHHLESNQVRTLHGELTFSDFQKRLWDAFVNSKVVSFTAPTSAGKSFALQNYLAAHALAQDRFIGVYLVPTRALITQVAEGLAALFRPGQGELLQVSTIPLAPPELEASRIMYVLTQERFQLLLDDLPARGLDLLIVDEAQSLGDDARGIILHSVVGRASAGGRTRTFFGSPQTQNPGLLLEVFGYDQVDSAVIREDQPAVSQNLILVETNGTRPHQVHLSLRVGKEAHDLGKSDLGVDLLDPDQSFAQIAFHFGKSEQNLVYGSTPSRCEDMARRIADIAEYSGVTLIQDSDREEVEDFASFLRKHIHKDYLLANVIERGVAFHYGNMPSIIRYGIEHLFCSGKIRYLVCTSTLLHGVNLPARNLFLWNPTKGLDWETRESISITTEDFWNLAGRAGRMGKDFEGNVFLIDYSRWLQDPFQGARNQEIRPALYEVLRDQSGEFASFVSDGNHPSGRHQAYENAFVELSNHARSGKLESLLANPALGLPESSREQVIASIEAASNSIDVPLEVSERNMNVSVFRQQELLDYFEKSLRDRDAAEVIPVHPKRTEAYTSLLRVFKRIHGYFQHIPKQNRTHLRSAAIALKWMRGEPYGRLIADAYKRRTDEAKRGSPSVSTVIRDMFAMVEQELRFRYVKYTRCYLDLLAEALRRSGQESLCARLPALPLYLELGACSGTMVNLIGLGVSRTTAAIIGGSAPSPDMNRRQVLDWVRRTNWKAVEIPSVCRAELEQVLL